MRFLRYGRIGLSVALVLGLTTGCGSDDESLPEDGGQQPEAQPAPDVTTFTEGGFDELPLPPRADPVGPRREDGDVVTRSFAVRNSAVEEVLQFYEGQLPGWEELGMEDLGQARRADFERGGRGLRVTVAPAPTLSGDDPRLQLTLQLGPPDAVFAG